MAPALLVREPADHDEDMEPEALACWPKKMLPLFWTVPATLWEPEPVRATVLPDEHEVVVEEEPSWREPVRIACEVERMPERMEPTRSRLTTGRAEASAPVVAKLAAVAAARTKAGVMAMRVMVMGGRRRVRGGGGQW